MYILHILPTCITYAISVKYTHTHTLSLSDRHTHIYIHINCYRVCGDCYVSSVLLNRAGDWLGCINTMLDM